MKIIGKDEMRSAPKALFLGLILLALADAVSAAVVGANDTISITVTVSEVTIVAITPDSLTWTNVAPGSRGTPTAVQIENMGSTNISRVWFNSSYPGSLPYGTSNFTLHDAGNYVVIRRNETGADWFHPNLVEYNESTLIYLTMPAGAAYHGRFRSAESEYFWALKNDSSGGNCTNGTFYIGVEPHNSTQSGTIDLSACALTLTQTGAAGCRTGVLTKYNSTWGYADIMVGRDGGGYTGLNYSLMVGRDCNQVFFYKWNEDLATAGSTNYDQDFDNTTIYPGGNLIANVNVHVPYGIPSGTKTGALTVFVQALTA